MQRKKIQSIPMILLLCSSLICMSGCQNRTIQTDFRNATYVNAQKGSVTKTTQERALDIKNIISAYWQIEDSAVVVEGHTAIVGIIYKEVDNHTTIHKELKEQIMKNDGYLERVSLTSTPYLVKMIKELEAM